MAAYGHWRGPLVFVVGLIALAGCGTGAGTLPADTLNNTEESSCSGGVGSDCQTTVVVNPDQNTTTPPPPEITTPECPPSDVVTMSMGNQVQYVLVNRQKFIGLEAHRSGVEYDSFTFSITQGPSHGQLMGTAPNVAYVPDRDYAGPDSFSYEAKSGCTTIQRTISLDVASSFVPPIGVPSPEFGITESHNMYLSATFDFGFGPEPYRDAGDGPYTHYVDYNRGSDAGNWFGTAAQPRKTIPTDLPAGSVVEVHGSGYDNLSGFTIRGNGTAANPIFIRGANAQSKPVLRRAVKIESNYTICENLEWDCRDFGTLTNEGAWFLIRERISPPATFHHICLRHSLFHDCPPNPNQGSTAIVVGLSNNPGSPNTSTDLVQQIVIYDVEARNFSNWDDFSGSTDFGGCAFQCNASDGWLVDSHLHHLHGDATGTSRSNGMPAHAPARNINIARNYLHNCRENGIDIKLCVGGILSQNTIHTIRKCNSALGEALTVHNNDANDTWPYSDNIWVIFNRIYDAENGIGHENDPTGITAISSSRLYVIGNLIFDIRNFRGVPYLTGFPINTGVRAQTWIINNMIYGCDYGLWLGRAYLDEPELCVNVVRNNIIANLTERVKSTTGEDALHLHVSPATILATTTIENNVHWEDVGAVHFDIMGPGENDLHFYSVSQMVAQTGLGAGSVIADPQFVDANLENFHVLPNSAALGGGIVDDSFATFASQFGLDINVHFDGTVTPIPPDIGAFGTP